MATYIIKYRTSSAAILLLALLIVPGRTSLAAFHQWHVKEVFSSADSSVQFVEMFNSISGENWVDGYILRAQSTVGATTTTKEFVFPNPDPENPTIPFTTDTQNKHLLIATTGFGSLPGGVAPDFTFADGGVVGPFFNPNADFISFTFEGSDDSIFFSGTSLPKDGINSLTDTNAFDSPSSSTPNVVAGVNSPTNINNQSGSINLSSGPTGDYNGNHIVDAADYVTWRNRLNQTGLTPGSGPDGSGNGTVDLADFTFWRSKFGNNAPGSAAGMPEPASLFALGFIAFVAAAGRHRR